jgi:hypothetical protein
LRAPPRNPVFSIDTGIREGQEALAGGDTHDWQVLERITNNRGPTMQRIRQLYLEDEGSLPSEQRTQLLRITTLVEREI